MFSKEYQNAKPSQVFGRFIGSACAIYIAHQWFEIPLAVGFAYTNIYPFAVILILAVVSPPVSRGAGILLKAIPCSNTIL